MLVAGVLLLGPGCDSNSPDSRAVKELSDQVGRLVDQASHSLSPLTPDTTELQRGTSEEIAKLFIFEYTVFDIPSSASPQEMQSTLMKVGQDRWECFASTPLETKLRFFCKRRPQSYLHFIPRWFPG